MSGTIEVSANSTGLQKTIFTWYKPLFPNSDKFRLLRVRPSLCFDSTLQCELYTAGISREKGRYIAGSYVWGPAEPIHIIQLDGKPFRVRQNVFRFLKAFRSRFGTRTIWIDAICINQDDVQERGHQVQEMKRIYSGARRVYCWLGYDKHIRQRDQLECIVQAEYWSRMWIIQEFILAKHIILLVGRDTLSYKRLLNIMERGPLTPMPNTSKQSKIHVLINFRMGGMWHFDSLFEQFGMLPCSVPQDGVFALLGLVGWRKEELELVGMIDYSLTVWQLLQRILAPNILERGPFRFAEQYNRFIIKGKKDQYMHDTINVELGQMRQWELCGPDDSRYTNINGSSLHITNVEEIPLRLAMAIRTSRVMKYSEAVDTDTIEIAMYTPQWRTVSERSGVSIQLSNHIHPLSTILDCVSTGILIEACDSQCYPTCATHAVLGFSWRFFHIYEPVNSAAPTIPIDVPLFARNTSKGVSRLIHDIQKGSMEMVETASTKVRVKMIKHQISDMPCYGLETDLETMVNLSAFIINLESSEAWPTFLELAMNRLIKPGTQEDVADWGWHRP